MLQDETYSSSARRQREERETQEVNTQAIKRLLGFYETSYNVLARYDVVALLESREILG